MIKSQAAIEKEASNLVNQVYKDLALHGRADFKLLGGRLIGKIIMIGPGKPHLIVCDDEDLLG